MMEYGCMGMVWVIVSHGLTLYGGECYVWGLCMLYVCRHVLFGSVLWCFCLPPVTFRRSTPEFIIRPTCS